MKGRVLAVTGAFGVLGRAVATAAAKQGARVAVIDQAPVRPGLFDEGAGEFAVFGEVDLSVPTSADAVMQAVAERWGAIDGLVNIAGGFRWRPVAEASPADWEQMLAVNLLTAVSASKAALPFLERGGNGAIVNVGAAAAQKALAGMGPYAASKAAVHRLTEALAEEHKGRIRVNAVLPSIIDTPANRADMPDADPSTWVSPEALAAVILFLASDGARAVTGALVPVTGRV